MNFPQKRQINVAAPAKRKHDLSHAHATTIDLARMKPIEMRYMVPGDEFNCNIRSVIQCLSSLPSPTFGSFNVNFRGFFVPINSIWSHFYDFVKNQQSVFNGEDGSSYMDVYKPPYCQVKVFTEVFRSVQFSTEVTGTPSVGQYDFYSPAGTGRSGISFNAGYFKFTKLGRVAYDFITAMRLNIPIGKWLTTEVNLLPLISFWKFYFDWIVPSRFILNHEDNIYCFIEQLNALQDPEVSVSDLKLYLLHEPFCYFMDDLFTTCTEYPFSEPAQMQDSISISNPASHRVSLSDVYAKDSDQIAAQGYPDGSYVPNQTFNMFTLQTLGKLQDLLNRNMLAGTKVQDWLLTEFGMRPSDDALHLSTYLGVKSNQMAISDILSTADTASQGGVSLGSYGGKLKERFDFDFSYKSKEHGYFFITFELVPRSNYFQGFEPEFKMIDRFDFFQPEFDNQQGAPITFGDLFFDGKDNNNYQTPETLWGFNLQYSRLKFANDVVSGDFRNRFGLSLKSWFMARQMDKYALVSSDIGFIDEEFCLAKSIYQDWNYIFADTSSELDHFIALFYFNMPCMRPMKSVTEGFEPIYQQGGKEVALNFSGSVQ